MRRLFLAAIVMDALIFPPTSSLAGEPATKEICIATTEIFPGALARNKYPDYKFSDLSNGETIGNLGLVFIDHIEKEITFKSIETEFSEFAIIFSCIELGKRSAFRS